MARGAKTTEPTEAAAAPKRPRKPRAPKAAPAEAAAGPAVDPEHPTPGQPPAPADPGKTCANCVTPLVGHYCHECGQQAHLHNKLGHLLHEFVEGIAHFDGRLWRTLPLLAWRPGRLSRDWIEGKRARYVAPLHIFLFAVFLMFTIPALIHYPEGDAVNINGVNVVKGKEARELMLKQQHERVEAMKANPGEPVDGPEKFATDAEAVIMKKVENFDYYFYKVKTLLYKLSFLMVPVSMAILWLLLIYKRGYSLYDHATVTLYGLGFLSLLVALGFMLPPGLRGVWTFFWMLFVPVHVVRHLKVAYSMSWPGAVGIGMLMGFLTLIGLGLFFAAVVALGVFG
ncbi:DUF3667 domain-containing protein [Caulobacter sp. SLTY]|uniref:DUF3667 domain-containing protein n=1 Tax=Caulobacter sp. SLTY TaxID=2683262 RepID=UPI001412B1EA|nr:DUF3667 domain-containing protein [Caulobacter sp. SLTY]NBB14828.1 DUF3667 domain-containing protein [Caulobacter sp. SLTY]